MPTFNDAPASLKVGIPVLGTIQDFLNLRTTNSGLHTKTVQVNKLTVIRRS